MKDHRAGMDRAEYLKHLYEKFLAKTDHKKDHKGRAKEAQENMTERLGEQWKEDADVEGMVFIEVETPQSSSVMEDRLKNYQSKVDHEGDKAGMAEAPDAKEESTEVEYDEGGLVAALAKLLEKYDR